MLFYWIAFLEIAALLYIVWKIFVDEKEKNVLLLLKRDAEKQGVYGGNCRISAILFFEDEEERQKMIEECEEEGMFKKKIISYYKEDGEIISIVLQGWQGFLQ